MSRWVHSLTADASTDRVREALPAGLRLGPERAERLRRTWVDSFDWGLHGRGLAGFFVRANDSRYEFTVRDLRAGTESSVALSAKPGLATDLPEGEARDLVAPAIDIRRLLELVTVTTQRAISPLLDRRDKTVGWVTFERRTASTPDSRKRHQMKQRVEWKALRGFDREVRAAADALLDGGLTTPDDERELTAALAAIGRTEGDYTSKLRFALDRAMPASAGLADIFEHLVDTMEHNEEGVVARLDEEFLHDYRVAVRRTRSALSHFGAALPPQTRSWAARFFADLGARTGAARDLDVLLIELPSYAHRLPPEGEEALAAMAGRFEEDVVREYARFARWLESRTYHRGIERWRRAIDKLRAGGNGATMGAVAAEAVAETAAKVFKQAKKIRKTDEDEPVHRLRIRCKKLRYMLEFCRSLTPGGEAAKLIATLKRLQDVLGTFNDLVVHQPRLTATAKRPPVDPDLLVATGQLLAELDHRHREVRREVDGVVERFREEAPPRLDRVIRSLEGKR